MFHLLRGVLLVSVLFVFGSGSLWAAEPRTLQVFGRSDCKEVQVDLSNEDWSWLRQKRSLVLGSALPDFPPYVMTASGTRYEGIAADIACIIGQALHVEVTVKAYPDRRDAMAALERGDIDMLGSSNSFELIDGLVTLSKPYVEDVPAMFMRGDDRRPMPANLAGLRIAVADDYLPSSQLHGLYPNAEFVLFPSNELALAALAFGKVDLFLGDTVSSNYLINLNYFNYVRLHSFVKTQTNGFSFALRRGNDQLLRLIDSVIESMGEGKIAEITKRWSGGGGALTPKRIDLTPGEARWLELHPVARFVINDDQAPFAFFDGDGNFGGIGADLLELIQRRTGLQIDVKRTDSFSSLSTRLLDGSADISLLTPTVSREVGMRFTHPFLASPFVIVTAKDAGAPSSLQELRGKRVAVPESSAERELLKDYPDIEIVDNETVLGALADVKDGRADAMITTLHSARYYIAHIYSDSLRISNIVGMNKGFLAFAARRADTELVSILNKALLSIPPDELDVILNRWRPIAAFSGLSWRDYKVLIYQISAGAFLIILGSLAWNFYIRRQIRERSRAERLLGDQLKFMGALINGTPHPIYVRDREGRLVTCNNNYLQTFGLLEKDVIGKTVLESGKRNRQEALQFHDDYLRVIERDEPYEVDRTLHVGDTRLIIYHWIQPYHDTTGEVRGVICGWIDISERRELIEELRSAKELADESSRAKTTFLATMSHEIRTPMSAVIGMLELTLKRAEQGHFDRPAIEVAYDSAKGLLELIGDILDVVRIESGHVSLSPKRANLRELVESVARVFDGLARQKSLVLKLDIDATVGCDVLVDPMRFQQVLSNLVGNAIKFTDTGHVSVSIRGQRLADERLQVDLKVEDTGIGISSADLQNLFQPFSQANHGPSNRGGTGLGLAISRSLCELMGGRLNITSTLGKGTCLEVSLFFNILSPLGGKVLPVSVVQDKPVPTLRILVVDDQSANRLLLTQQLSFLGQAVRDAADGAQALALWRSEPFDIVITDCNMPVMNGYELARTIRLDERDSGGAPCIVLGFTANAQPEEKVKCREAGMDDCLFKPISLSTLSTLLAGWEKDVETEPVESPPAVGIKELGSIRERLTELTGGDLDMMKELLREALSSCEKDLEELHSLIPESDPGLLADLAHRIKGAARIVAEHQVIEACNDLEAECEAPVIDPLDINRSALKLEHAQADLIKKIKRVEL
ncbi:transporter substrate-binding domain-containing protein [Pseudomonas zeae]|uniref:transporter substrate-binding domain-containing protein n=1 Tax=Pseudomonas zeae TaxID=2745510 RepID=UPI0021483575|nr:transporter substrate-binding domain-containing protein [Pseudomonas zeae]UUT10207.1 transporter substrate-binding domain-containing protein [Pseudomonas zeae]